MFKYKLGINMKIYHGTSRKTTNGIMKPIKGMVHGNTFPTKQTEEFLEDIRQQYYSDSRSRLKCVFGSPKGDPLNLCAVGALMHSVLECETEEPEFSNVGWYSIIRRTVSNIALTREVELMISKWACSYWAGEAFSRRNVYQDLEEVGIKEHEQWSFVADAWEARCDKLLVKEVKDNSEGEIKQYKIKSWGHKNDMVCIEAYYSKETKVTLQRMGYIIIKDNTISVQSNLSISSASIILKILGQDGLEYPKEEEEKSYRI